MHAVYLAGAGGTGGGRNRKHGGGIILKVTLEDGTLAGAGGPGKYHKDAMLLGCGVAAVHACPSISSSSS